MFDNPNAYEINELDGIPWHKKVNGNFIQCYYFPNIKIFLLNVSKVTKNHETLVFPNTDFIPLNCTIYYGNKST